MFEKEERGDLTGQTSSSMSETLTLTEDDSEPKIQLCRETDIYALGMVRKDTQQPSDCAQYLFIQTMLVRTHLVAIVG